MIEAKSADAASSTSGGKPRILEAVASKAPQGITHEIVLITPEMAKLWIETKNRKNRRITQSTVRKYAKAMRSGTFKFNGEPISFNERGDLHNGQHRLLAIIESGIPQHMLVVYGVPAESFDTVDTGLKRNAGHVLSIEGSSAPVLAASTCRLVLAYKSRSTGSRGVSPKDYDNSEVRDYWRENDEIELASLNVSQRKRDFAAYTSEAVSSTFYVLALQAGYTEAFINDFFYRISNGANLTVNHPILTLRNKLSRMKLEKRVGDGNNPMNTLVMYIRAFNALVENRTLASVFGIKVASGSTTSQDTYPAIIRRK